MHYALPMSSWLQHVSFFSTEWK